MENSKDADKHENFVRIYSSEIKGCKQEVRCGSAVPNFTTSVSEEYLVNKSQKKLCRAVKALHAAVADVECTFDICKSLYQDSSYESSLSQFGSALRKIQANVSLMGQALFQFSEKKESVQKMPTKVTDPIINGCYKNSCNKIVFEKQTLKRKHKGELTGINRGYSKIRKSLIDEYFIRKKKCSESAEHLEEKCVEKLKEEDVADSVCKRMEDNNDKEALMDNNNEIEKIVACDNSGLAKSVNDKSESLGKKINSDSLNEYEVARIKDCKKKMGEYWYLVSWHGYGPEDDTWEPVEHITSCADALCDFFCELILEKKRSFHNGNIVRKSSLPDDLFAMQNFRQAFRKIYLTKEFQESQNLSAILADKHEPRPLRKIDNMMLKLFSLKKADSQYYRKLEEEIISELSYYDIKKKRAAQQVALKDWENMMNSISTDPAPLTVENLVDLAMPPDNFVYINELQAGPGITIPSEPFVGCECEECSIGSKKCCAPLMNSVFPYTKQGRLRVILGTPIYECNNACQCPPTCHNRVVQKGRCIKLCIFRTSNGRGWGVKTMELIKKDTFVTEYVGEVITSEEAERRGKVYDAQGCTYLFDLDYNRGETNPYTVDAAMYGNISHFINHSCSPNLAVFNVWVNCLDPDLPKLALFTSQEIKKGEELTFDYNACALPNSSTGTIAETEGLKTPPREGTTGRTSKGVTPKAARVLQNGKTECRCGSDNCRKYFF